MSPKQADKSLKAAYKEAKAKAEAAAAANGAVDQAYLGAITVQGGKVVIAEASGEVEAFAPRREAVLAALQAL